MLPGKKYKPIDLAQVAWRRRWYLAVPTLVGGYVALVICAQLPNMYRSEMLIQVVPQRVPDTYVRSTVTMRTEDRLNALSQQVMSRTQLEKLIEQMNLYPRERARLPMQDVVERMRADINIEVVRSQRDSRETDAFYVRFTYPDPVTAASVTERIGALYVDVNSQDRGVLAEATNTFLQAQLREARARLEEQERKVEEFRKRNSGRLPTQLPFNMQAIQATQTQVQALTESLARDRDRKLMLERLYNDAEAELATPVQREAQAPSASPTDPLTVAASPAQQLVLARQALERLQLRLKPEHPDIIRTKRLIDDLEKQIAASASGREAAAAPVLTSEEAARRERFQQMRAEIDSLGRQIAFKEAEEQRLRGVIADYQHRIEQVPGVESEWTAVTRDYDTQQAAYKELLAKSEEASVAAELEKRQVGEQFRVLDPARPASRPVGWGRLQVNAMGIVVGLLFGVAWVALLEFLDTSFHSSTDIADVLKLRVIAEVPYAPNEGDRRHARRRKLLAASFATFAVALAGYGFWVLRLWKHVV